MQQCFLIHCQFVLQTPQAPNQEQLSQLLPSQWGVVHLFDLCLWFGHVDTASALAMRGVPGCILEDHHDLGPFSSRDSWGVARPCGCHGWNTCPCCCWAFPVEQGIWMEDWDAELFKDDWNVERGAISAAREAAATPLIRAMLDICSCDMDLPFSGSPKAMARLLDIAILTGNRAAAVNLSKRCLVRPLRRWVMNWNNQGWKAARIALWAGADFQDLMVKHPFFYGHEDIPFPQALFLKSKLEDWQEIRHLLPWCRGLCRPVDTWFGKFFFERPPWAWWWQETVSRQNPSSWGYRSGRAMLLC